MIGAQLDCPQNFRMKEFEQAEIWSLIIIRQTFDLLITIQFFYYDFCGIIFDKN